MFWINCIADYTGKQFFEVEIIYTYLDKGRGVEEAFILRPRVFNLQSTIRHYFRKIFAQKTNEKEKRRLI